jgi:flagellar FliL protein
VLLRFTFDRNRNFNGSVAMTNAAEIADAEPAPKTGKLGLILGLVGALALGGGGFYAVYAGMLQPSALLGGGGHDTGGHASGGHGSGGHGVPEPAALADVAFVPMDPIMISLNPGGTARHLRFSGQLEVAPEDAATVAALMPRVLDVLNTYLRAVQARDIEDPAALARLRAQMLRRIQVVTGDGQVRDLLITEFVLN